MSDKVRSHRTRKNKTPQAVSTQLAEWWGAGRLKLAESRARLPPPCGPDRGRRLPKRVRLDYVPRSAVRELSCQLHNGVVGLCSPVSLLPPSFLSGGPAQNVGPSVARIPRVSSLAYTRALSLSFSLAPCSRLGGISIVGTKNHLGRGVSETRHDEARQTRRVRQRDAAADVRSEPRRRLSDEVSIAVPPADVQSS